MPESKLADSEALFPAWGRPFYRPFKGPVEALLGLDRINALYERCKGGSPEEFSGKVLAELGVEWSFPPSEIERLRSQRGPLIVAANHPFGGPEAILLLILLSQIRPDYRVLANYVLGAVEEVQTRLIRVDPFGSPRAAAKNQASLRSALAWLKNDGLLAMFPAGEVSSWSFRNGRVTDAAWKPQVARLAILAGAPVLPLHFDGHNGLLFQAAGLVNPALRTLLLPRCLLRPARRRLSFRFGAPVPAARLETLGGPDDAAAYLRERCYLLKTNEDQARQEPRLWPPVAERAEARILDAEVASLRAQSRVLACQGAMEVLHFKAQEAPGLFHEIGRLRELAFREAGEGSGLSMDHDAFDLDYTHLVAWDASRSAVAGAYRLVEADPMLKQKGPQGLYSHSLFRLKPGILKDLRHAVELGRSFVSPDYQKDYLPLLLLWRGIGAWVAAHPSITRLFGCVSISPDFRPLTQQLLVAFLKSHSFDSQRAAWVEPRSAFRNGPGFGPLWGARGSGASLKDLQELVDEIEGGRLRVPTLLRHYLKLGGRILAFNIDPGFNNTLDGLFLVELPKSPAFILEKYMGTEAAQAYLALHRERKAA